MGCFNSKVADVKMVGVAPGEFSRPIQTMRSFMDETKFNAVTFKFIASDPTSQEYFMRFLATEHATENLEFFKDVDFIRAKGFTDRHDLMDRGKDLVNKFLIINAPNEVNVSDRMKKNIIETVNSEHTPQKEQELLRHLEKAQNEVLIILSMGSFPRFLKSNLFEDYKRENGSSKMNIAIRNALLIANSTPAHADHTDLNGGTYKATDFDYHSFRRVVPETSTRSEVANDASRTQQSGTAIGNNIASPAKPPSKMNQVMPAETV